ncbi:MAG: tyrosinase family protein [Pseudolabrys sp.]|nr:tyrosinase family protein [Pseudolabrys sp.]
MSATPIYPVAHPTWYDTIRMMFTSTDIAHMGPQGLDLTSYEQVKNGAGGIYGQVSGKLMPPGKPWTPDMIQTFLNWIVDSCPKGTPASSQVAAALSLAATKSAASRIRKDVTTLSAGELNTLKKAFEGVMAKDVTDPNSYFVQAGYHWLPSPLYCLHHVPGYNPWHRAYMLSFENALRSVPGCENVTLPYWDITTPFPEVLKSAPFDKYTLPQDIGGRFVRGYTTSRYSYSDIQSNLKAYDVTADLNRALSKADWEDFHGFWSGAPYNTIIAAHDGGHGSIGPTMADQSVAAFDPIFWFFHANWDRLWWEWQKKVAATDLYGLLSTINKTTDALSYQIFTISALSSLAPFTSLPIALDAIKVIDSVKSLDVDYAPAAAQPSPIAFALKTSRTISIDRDVSLAPQRAMVSVTGVNRLKVPGSFAVHLMKDGKPLASRFMFQPDEPDQCETCVKNGIAHFDFDLPLADVAGGKLRVEVEPMNKAMVGPRFPVKMMGEPKIDVHIPLQTD